MTEREIVAMVHDVEERIKQKAYDIRGQGEQLNKMEGDAEDEKYSMTQAARNITDLDLQNIETEQYLTDVNIASIETEQTLTDLDLRVMELETKTSEEGV